MDQDPLGAMNGNMDRHCAGQNILSVFFNDTIAGGDGKKLVYLYPYTTSGTCAIEKDTHEHLDAVVRFQRELFGEGVDRDFLTSGRDDIPAGSWARGQLCPSRREGGKP
jgi:hypothetical protein